MPFSQFEIVKCLLLLEGSIGLEGSGCLVLAGRSYKLGSAANIFFTNLEVRIKIARIAKAPVHKLPGKSS